MSDEIGTDLEKMKSREKYLNQQLEGFVTQLRTSHDKLAHAKVHVCPYKLNNCCNLGNV